MSVHDSSAPVPSFRSLSHADALSVLARNHIGRIAYSLHDRVDIVPVHYAYEGNWIYGRTQMGRKVTILEHHRWVAFEVDESDDLFDWRSVVVKGPLEIIPDSVGPNYQEIEAHAEALMRQLIPTALTEEDPVAFRTILFRIHLSEVSAREATTKVHR